MTSTSRADKTEQKIPEPPVLIDRSAGDQDYLDISYKLVDGTRYRYTVKVFGPAPEDRGSYETSAVLTQVLQHVAADLPVPKLTASRPASTTSEPEVADEREVSVLYELTSDKIVDRTSIAVLVAQAMARDPFFCFGRDQMPYRWVVNHWEPAEKWLLAVDYAMHVLIRTQSGKSSNLSLRSEVLAAFRALSPYPAHGATLYALGAPGAACAAVPFEASVLCLYPGGKTTFRPHNPAQGNLHFLKCDVAMLPMAAKGLQADLKRDEPKTHFVRFLKSSVPREDYRDVLKRWFGYHLVSSFVPNAEKMVYLWGRGGNGKSQLVNLLRGMLGQEACAEVRLSDLRRPAILELLVGKIAMLGNETAAGTDLERLKGLISREPQTCDPKYRDPFVVEPECLVTQASNYPPTFAESSDAMSRRVISLHLEASFTGEGRVQDYSKLIIEKEFDLLLAWAVEGAIEVLTEGRFTVPSSVLAESAEVVTKGNPVNEFMDVLEFGPYEVAVSELYLVFDRWLKKNSQRNTLSTSSFLTEMTAQASKRGHHVLHRDKATLYAPQQWVDDQGRWVYVDPKLPEMKRYPILLGVRVAEDGPFGDKPIGCELHPDRKNVEMLGSGRQPSVSV